jgi:hypothetical protein
MSIVSSTYEIDAHVQADGRRYVREFHTDSGGAVHVVEYLSADGANYQATANSRAAAIAESLADEEAEAIING